MIFLALLIYLIVRKNPSAKGKLAYLDLLFTLNHRNGPMPSFQLERQTIFGAFMGLCTVLAFSVLATFLVLNWYYSPVLSSNVVPFGYFGEADPVANISVQLQLWGFSGNCDCSAMRTEFQGLGLSSASSIWRINCTQLPYSCAVDIGNSGVVVSSLGSMYITMPPGTAMGMTYFAEMSPSLNSSVIQRVSETVWAGTANVFGGPIPIVVPLSTTWAKLNDEVRNNRLQGWVLSATGTSPGSVLDNSTYLTATDKTVRINMLFSRGSTFLQIVLAYSSSLPVLIGAILGYFSGIMSLGATLMRIGEALHQRKEIPPSVQKHLSQLTFEPTGDSLREAKLKAIETLEPGVDMGVCEI